MLLWQVLAPAILLKGEVKQASKRLLLLCRKLTPNTNQSSLDTADELKLNRVQTGLTHSGRVQTNVKVSVHYNLRLLRFAVF